MDIDKKILVGMLDNMLRIRAFEQKAKELFAGGKIPGFVHLYAGEEAVASGVCANLNDKDFITSTHRGHGHLIAKGGQLNEMMAELFGKSGGYCKGKGGSMHIASVDLGILGANGIVGAGQPIATGAAFATKYLNTDAIAVCFFGDGASNRGTFHESLNLASAWKLPVVFVCENNLYGISNRQTDAMNIVDISDRAKSYGIPGVTVDGNDVLAVYEAAKEAVARARKGDGPSLIECKTWRHHGHFEGDSSVYKKKDEQTSWMSKDPIPRYEKKLLELGVLNATELAALRDKVDADLASAIDFADRSPYPNVSEVLTDVLA
ncbi:MAG: thiamine pyrophosphate-dependent dehydrogenase E1 component subunit alpha [Deltaproteobacteria bacterium]|jgi:pyruvate dehydrogenase E1 component alpha subunit|nr:thiamine pyrophosphate-dependent dehydrogenase E1 component subunit alpha [Deltaproteobacteria bacterium]